MDPGSKINPNANPRLIFDAEPTNKTTPGEPEQDRLGTCTTYPTYDLVTEKAQTKRIKDLHSKRDTDDKKSSLSVTSTPLQKSPPPAGGGLFHYFNKTIFLTEWNSPAEILYKYIPALTGCPVSLVASQIIDLNPALC